MKTSLHFFLPDESKTRALAVALAQKIMQGFAHDGLQKGLVIYLKGDLGAGKSYLSRALIQYFLPGQKVKSPTYTLVESYPVTLPQGDLTIHHFDLYRLCEPEELEYLAIRDLLSGNFVALVEWPQNGQPVLPPADIELEFTHLAIGREMHMVLLSDKAQNLMRDLVF